MARASLKRLRQIATGSAVRQIGAGLPALPANATPPAITGTPQVGQTLAASQGTWSGSPTSYAYQWRRGGVPISGATGSAYAPVAADVGQTLTVAVTATNAAGATTAASAPTAAVTAAAATGGTLDFSDPANSGHIPGV